jgi:hypothetical protein
LLPIPHLVALVLVAAAVRPGSDDLDACKLAAERYKKVKAEIEAATQVFSECVAQPWISSCTVEFEELAVWQDRLETAVADYRTLAPDALGADCGAGRP